MNKGPNVCGDDGKMPEGYSLNPPKINHTSEQKSTTKYFLYGIQAEVYACTPDILPTHEITSGYSKGGIYYIELGGKKWFFFEKDIVIKSDGSVQLDGKVYSEI